MDYINFKSILKNLPFKKEDEWIRIDIEKSADELFKEMYQYYKIVKINLIDTPEVLKARLERELRLFTNILHYDERTMEEVEFWLNLIDNVRTGKTIIFGGKGLKMMNADKYIEYLEREDLEEPVSKKILLAEYEELKNNNARLLQNCERWFELLGKEGINSKAKVRDEIEAVLEELKGDKYESL